MADNVQPNDPTPAPDEHDHWIKNQLTWWLTNNPAFLAELVNSAKAAIGESDVLTTANVASAIYRPVLDAIWLNLEKLVQGTDNPTGMDAQQLHDAFVALIHNTKGE